MSFKNLIAKDYLVLEGTEPVTYTPQNQEQEPVEVAGARFRPIDSADVASQGLQITNDMATCILPEVNMPGIVPRNGDKVTAGEDSDWAGDWIVVSVNTGPFRGRWKLTVQQGR